LKAQDFQGIAVYELKLVNSNLPTTDIKVDYVNNKELNDAMKVLSERKRTFVLKFNKNESVYQEEEQLELPKAPSKGIVIKMLSTGFGKTYKNLSKKQIIVERDLLSKEFLVTEPLVVIDWKFESETKKIGEFTCNKAIAIIPVSEAEKEAYQKRKNEEEQNNSQFLTSNSPEPRTITVWYSPEIPVNHGPSDLWGLPGLILEVNDGRTVKLCSKVVLNTKDNLKINIPTKGTVLSQREYDALECKKTQEMRDFSR
jgi:GLPGLI family protein